MRYGYCLILLPLFCCGLSFCQPYTISTVAGTERLLDGKQAVAVPLRGPIAVAVDSQGNVYIADRDDNRVRRVSAAGVISTFAGTGQAGYSGDRGEAKFARLNSPLAVALDSKGNLYIADYLNSVVRRVSPDGVINTVAGNGTVGFSGDNGAALSAQVDPIGITLDSKDNLYIADGLNFRVRKVDAKGVITTIAGTGKEGNTGDNGPALSAQIELPSDIAVDQDGNVFVATLYWVRRIDAVSGKITTVAGSGTFGFIVDGVAATQALLAPSGLALDNHGTLFIADVNRNQVRRVDLASGLIATVAGNAFVGFSGDNGSAFQAELNSPYGLALNAGGDVYVSDLGNARIRKVSGGIITTVAGTDIRDGGQATSVFLNFPGGVAVDASKNFVLADTGNLEARRFTDGGSISGFGQLQMGSSPFAVAADQGGNFYVSDSEPRLLRITRDGVTTIVAGNGTDDYTGDGGPATSASISKPTGVAVDTANNIYVSDYRNNRIRKIAPGGLISTIAGNGKILASGDGGPALSAGIDPYDIATDDKLNLYVVDNFNSLIRKIDPSGTITTVAGTGTPGYSGDGGRATDAMLQFPTGVAVDKAGNLYVADNGNSVVRRVTAGGLITTIAGNGTSFPGSGDGGPAISAQLDPFRVAADSNLNIYVTDKANDRVRKLTPKGGVPSAMTVVSGNQQIGNVNIQVGSPLVVKVADRNGAGLAGVLVTFTASPSGSAIFSLSTAITLNDGTASTKVTLGSLVGAVTVTASADGVPSVSFTLTAVSPTAPVISTGGIVSAGLSTPRVTALAVNSIASIFGNQFAPVGTNRQVSPADLVSGKIPNNLAGVCVIFGTQRAPILVVVANQLNVQVPELPPGPVSVQVITKCDTPQAETSNALSTQIQAAAPEFFYFTHTANGHNPVAAVNAVTGAYIGAPGLIAGVTFVPAKPGDILTIFATGFGATDPAIAPGEIPSAAAQIAASFSISFGGVTLAPSDVLYVGVSGNAGVYQLSIRVPDEVGDGDQQFVITIGGVASSAGGFITVQR